MARDSQAALVALNRFGFGARGGASGDFVNAASDPRGFVKAELSRPNGVLLEVPGLLSTPALGQAVFAYQFEIKQARDAAAKSGAPPPMRPEARAAKGSGEIFRSAASPPTSPARPRRWTPTQANAAMPPAETMQPDAAKPAPPPAAAAQHHPEDLSRRGAGAVAARHARRLRIRRAAGGVLVQPFLHLRQQGRAGADVGGLVRARGDPAPCAGALRRHAQGGRAASGDAVLSRQPAIARPGIPRRRKPQARAERKSRARDHGAAYARRRRRLFAGRRDLAGAHHHRLDLCRTAGTTRRARQLSSSTPMRISRARSGCSARSTRTTASRRARRRWRISRAIPRPRNSSRPNSRVTSSPTIRRRRWWRGCRTCSSSPTAISRRWRRRWWIPTKPGRRR